MNPCAQCGKPGPILDVLPYLYDMKHVYLHQACSRPYYRKRYIERFKK